MQPSRKVLTLIILAFFLAILFSYFIWFDLAEFYLFPIALLLVYLAIFQTETLFLSLAFFTPFSINIEEFSKSFGLFIPTEPLLFGLMLILLFFQFKTPFVDKQIWKHPIIISVLVFISWMFVTAITSSNVLVSFKFILSKLWFIVPILFFGTHFFKKEANRNWFILLFIIATSCTIIYTLIHHSTYDFGEKAGHWVMSPFFKDHTIYGAIIAMIIPLLLSWYFSEKYAPLIQISLIGIIIIVFFGLYFSYTRAAWLSIAIAIIVGLIIHFKVNYKILLFLASVACIFLFFQWDTIQIELARNTHEHTTEAFDERIQSAANVTTDESNLERINRWNCALSMFQQRPIFGYGPGTYALEYAPFQEAKNLTIISTNFGDMGNAHSEYLGALAEMGLIGLLTFIAFVIAIFYSAIQLYYSWPADDKQTRIKIFGMILSLTTYFSHAFLNNFLDTDKAAIPVLAMCSIIIVLDLKRRQIR
ncbi:MAG: O-antigen ligase family protein [Flavobacteriia bacterium]|nr:O-antigen ligase family protein [Flavobacteriia bacterium]